MYDGVCLFLNIVISKQYHRYYILHMLPLYSLFPNPVEQAHSCFNPATAQMEASRLVSYILISYVSLSQLERVLFCGFSSIYVLNAMRRISLQLSTCV